MNERPSPTVELTVAVSASVVIRVDVGGVGPPVVILHGFTGDASTMALLADRMRRSHRVAVPDLIGHGGSSAPPDPSIYGVDQMGKQVVAVADSIGIDDFHLIGYSMGGRTALALACDRPARVRSLCLIGASAGIADPAGRARRRGDDEDLADRIENGGIEDFVDEWMAKPLFASQTKLGAGHIRNSRKQRLLNRPIGLANSLRGGGTGAMEPLHRLLPRCNVPTLLIAGEDDPKFRSTAQELAGLLPDAETLVVPSSGHAVHLEQPDEVADCISRHISRVESS